MRERKERIEKWNLREKAVRTGSAKGSMDTVQKLGSIREKNQE